MGQSSALDSRVEPHSAASSVRPASLSSPNASERQPSPKVSTSPVSLKIIMHVDILNCTTLNYLSRKYPYVQI